MKIAIAAYTATALLASLAFAQSDPAACTLCLQKALQALPVCANVRATAGSVTAEYATCLCSSLAGNWIDSCKSSAQCGSTIDDFKASYASMFKLAGLNCNGNQASFTPASV
ncbi:hypothetical protein BGZ68_004397 [Mortierella alpina]|nr:hypothetical protein BGZ68_004397 [Mortierella alpina]